MAFFGSFLATFGFRVPFKITLFTEFHVREQNCRSVAIFEFSHFLTYFWAISWKFSCSQVWAQVREEGRISHQKSLNVHNLTSDFKKMQYLDPTKAFFAIFGWYLATFGCWFQFEITSFTKLQVGRKNWPFLATFNISCFLTYYWAISQKIPLLWHLGTDKKATPSLELQKYQCP